MGKMPNFIEKMESHAKGDIKISPSFGLGQGKINFSKKSKINNVRENWKGRSNNLTST